MARARIAISAPRGGVQHVGTTIEVFADKSDVGFWEGRESSGISQARVEQIVRKHVRAKVEEATREAREVTREIMPRRSGRTANAVASRVTTEPNGRIIGTVFVREARAQIARWLDQGTGLYGPQHSPIRPISSKELRWPRRDARAAGRSAFTQSDELSATGRRRLATQGSKGLYNYSPSVRGQRPQHIFEKAARRSRPLAAVDFREAARDAAAELRLRART